MQEALAWKAQCEDKGYYADYSWAQARFCTAWSHRRARLCAFAVRADTSEVLCQARWCTRTKIHAMCRLSVQRFDNVVQAYFGGVIALFSEDRTNADLAAKLDFFVNCHFERQNGIKRTPKGLTFVNAWGSLRHAAGAAAILARYARSLLSSDVERAAKILDFAESQVRRHLSAPLHNLALCMVLLTQCPAHRHRCRAAELRLHQADACYWP